MLSRTVEPAAEPDDFYRRLGEGLRPLRRHGKAWSIHLIDGPNMSNLGPGGRDPRTYGPVRSIGQLQRLTADFGSGMGCEVSIFQSNHEGAIVEYIYDQADAVDAFVINPAGSTKRGVPLAQAFHDVGKPCLEMHFANVAALGWLNGAAITREVQGVVMGMRHYSYVSALFGLVLMLDQGGGSR